MAKINILDSSVFNRIAAGEVVDRPYSVVKEFVENSIDAGATSISIEIERGGKDRICVSDNGSGIEREDFTSAFLPHATSKIARVEDLDVIMTLGFRGEALAEYRIRGERDRQIPRGGRRLRLSDLMQRRENGRDPALCARCRYRNMCRKSLFQYARARKIP